MSNPRSLIREKSLMMPEVRNPFVHNLHFTWLDKLQLAVMTVTVFPIRIVLIFFFLVLAWGLASIALLGRTKEEAMQPLKGWRKLFAVPLIYLGKAAFYTIGFRVTIRGKQATAAEAPIMVVAPHSALFDVAVGFFSNLPSTVAAAEPIHKTPFAGTLTKYTQPVFVSREDPNSRQNTIQEIKRRARSGGAWPQIVIFPEGTCTNRNCLISFKPGAFYPGVPVQPVCLKYNNRLDTVTWTWEGPDAFHCLWYTLCQFHTNLEVEFLPVYTPTEEEINDAKLYGRNVREVMAKAMKVPTSDHTYEDTRLMNYAAKLDMPAATGLVEFSKLSRKLGISYENMKDMLTKFCTIAQNNKGIVNLEEFARYLELPVSESLTEMFHMYDRDGSDTVDFREYVIGLSLIAMPANNEDTIMLAFKVFDGGNKGYITEQELSDILNAAFGMSEVDVHNLFVKVDQDKDGRINYDEFKAYAVEKPEYAHLFWTYQQRKAREEEEEAAAKNLATLTKRFVNGNTTEQPTPTSATPVADMSDKAKAE